MANNKESVMDGFSSGRKGGGSSAAALDNIKAPVPDIIPYDVDNLIDHPENITLFKSLDAKDFERLKKDIEKNGIHDALIVTPEKNGKRTVLAGHNRLMAAKELKLFTVPVRELDLDKKQQTSFIIRDNLNRRQLSAAEKIILLTKLYPDEMDNEDKGGRPEKGDTVSPLKTIPEIAAEIGQSERSVQRAKQTHQKTKKKTGKETPLLKDYEETIKKDKPVKTPVAPVPKKTPDKPVTPAAVNYTQAYNHLLKRIEDFIKKNKNVTVIEELKQDVEIIKNTYKDK